MEEAGVFNEPAPRRSKPMLVLSRKLNEEIRIAENIVVRIVGIKGNQVRLGIVAPADVPILREEILSKVLSVSKEAVPRSRVLKCARC